MGVLRLFCESYSIDVKLILNNRLFRSVVHRAKEMQRNRIHAGRSNAIHDRECSPAIYPTVAKVQREHQFIVDYWTAGEPESVDSVG